jgi:hypothetical protein
MWKTEKSFKKDKKEQRKSEKRVKTTPKKCHVWIILSQAVVENSVKSMLLSPAITACPHAVW